MKKVVLLIAVAALMVSCAANASKGDAKTKAGEKQECPTGCPK